MLEAEAVPELEPIEQVSEGSNNRVLDILI